MNIVSISKMVVSSSAGWPELERSHPPLVSLFAYVVLPLSVLPPIMLYHAGSSYGDAIVAGYGGKPWDSIALVFFLTEVFTLFVMGWLIRRIAEVHEVSVSSHDAYMLAGIAPIPLWLSSLGLLVPSLPFNAGLSLVALAASCGLIYHGVYALCHMHEEVSAAAITWAVMGAGLVAWALLLLIVVGMPVA
jgi:Yip1 domain